MNPFLEAAIREAREPMRAGRGGPFGAVVVQDGKIVGRGHNCVTSAKDPTAHAEVVAIRAACRALDVFHLEGCELYTSCEPCPMCLGAAYWAHVERIVYAATREDAARAGFDDSMIYSEIALPLAERSIPMVSMDRTAAVNLFDEWRELEGRIDY